LVPVGGEAQVNQNRRQCLMICGSLRKGSFNRAFMNACRHWHRKAWYFNFPRTAATGLMTPISPAAALRAAYSQLSA
jgi:hypothetical protein